MPFNLLDSPWLPLRRRDGAIAWAAPPALAESDVTTIAWPRADFSLAATEFLIGLLATAFAPRSEDEWAERWYTPPTPEELARAFAPFAPAFVLDGDGPRFGQDFEELPGSSKSLDSLLIEAPGEATVEKNTALLVKPGRVAHLSRAAAAVALHTLQTYAPSGGRGNLTSLRGGGPLTTLVLPGHAPTLWQTLWANVPRLDEEPPTGPDPAIFPWMAPTRTSEAGRTTSLGAAHPLQAFWGLPRRIRLDFTANAGGVSCDLGGPGDEVLAIGWRQRPYGVKYLAFRHPLSPYYQAKGAGWLPVHPQPGGIGYRHWVGLVLEDPTRQPARVIAEWTSQRSAVTREARFLAAGYDMDNAKARAFVESEMPLPGTLRAAARPVLDAQTRCLVQGAEQAAAILRSALRDALLADGDATPVQSGVAAFWAGTQEAFFAALRHCAGRIEAEDAPDLLPDREEWRRVLHRAALDVFHGAVPLDRAFQKPVARDGGPPREVAALRGLQLRFAGFQASGAALFKALNLPAPEVAAPRGRRKAKETA